MSEGSNTQKNFAIFLAAMCVMLLLSFSAYAVVNQSAQSNLKQQLADAQKQVAEINQQITESKIEVAEEKAQQARDIETAMQQVDSPAARFALIKKYYTALASKLKPESKQQLDTVIVYIEKNPIVLVQPNELPAEYSKIIQSLRQELASVSAKAPSVATLKQATTAAKTASPSAVVGKTYTLVGTLSFAAEDPTLGGGYFKLNDTNYGDPFVIYLSPSNVPAAKDLEGEKVSITVKVTGQADGFVTYDVLSGPIAAK